MLNRRILRIKAFKTVYTLVENPAMDVAEALMQLEASCESTRKLYLFLLALIPALTREASARTEAARSKFRPTEEELNPNMKFVHNRIAPVFEQDPDFIKLTEKYKLTWDQYDAFVWHLYDSVRASGYFADYMASPRSDIAEDAALWKEIFTRELEDNSELADILEEKSVWWNDDLGYALICCCKAMDGMSSSGRWVFPELYQSQMQGRDRRDSDRDFVRGIVREAVTGYSREVSQISALTPKWDISRVCATDLALIVTGLAEHNAFPEMDPRIIINEYVEISKYYSTPDSKSFVNGLLDKLINTH